jgi:glycolate oxidase FAD binding subunit
MDIAADIQAQILEAAAKGEVLKIIGNGSKTFLGRTITGKPLRLADYSGILDYQPDELTISARAGTPLTEIIELLSSHRQMLPFEPATFDGRATLGGCIAAASAGPRRPWTGAARDYVIGMRVLTGEGKDIRLGGKVMKNVAGYDLFRPMVGALGTLGAMLEITLKLLPLPEAEKSFSIEASLEEMQQLLHQWTYASYPVSAAVLDNGVLRIRLSGAVQAVEHCAGKLPDGMQEIDAQYWQQLNEQKLPFFDDDLPLYRMVLPASAPMTDFDSDGILDWGGALRWVKTDRSFDDVQASAVAAGGSASCYRNGDREEEVFAPLNPTLFALHKRIKKVMDPPGILNPGRLYRNL